MLTGAQLVHVPYKSGAAAIRDVFSDQIPVPSFTVGNNVYTK
jgi:tripartite-type tricarboxylate transporter receptor subunit TctC